MTVVLASSCAGDILPFQSVWGGTTAASFPAKTAHRRDEADKEGFIYGHGDTRHWSSRATTKDVPYLLPYNTVLGPGMNSELTFFSLSLLVGYANS